MYFTHNHTSEFRLATFQVLSNHLQLVPTILGRTVLDKSLKTQD